jgi:UMP-CMP kinase family protein
MRPSPSVPLLVAVLGTLLSGGDAAVVQPRGAAMGGAGAMTRNHLSALRSRSSHIMCVMSADAGQQLSKASAAAPEGLVYFVMGGPGSGKGTQCAKLVERFGMVHLSAGDLLRAEVASGSKLGQEISAIIDQGQIVRSETTVALLRNGMAGKRGPFLIDGFPRSLENLEAFEADVGKFAFMLFLQVSEEEMEKRLLRRGETSGRSDDNRETIVKRFRAFHEMSMPVIDQLEARGLLRRVDAGEAQAVVFSRVCESFADQDWYEAAEEEEEEEEEEEK